MYGFRPICYVWPISEWLVLGWSSGMWSTYVHWLNTDRGDSLCSIMFGAHSVCPYDIESSSAVVVRSRGAYRKLSGHRAWPELGWVPEMRAQFWASTLARLSSLELWESFSWLSIVIWKRSKIEVPPTTCYMLGELKDSTLGVTV